MSQKQIKKTQTATKTEEKVEETPKTDSKEDLKAEMDEILDEIDGVLEENAETFVKNYVQRGGQATWVGSIMEAWKRNGVPIVRTISQGMRSPKIAPRLMG